MSDPVYISKKVEGYSHPKCYLSHTKGCATKITGEHCISHNLLNKIEKKNKTIDIMGLSWLPKDNLKSIGKSSLVSNVLCENHNSALSPLDAAIGDLVEAIGNIDAEFIKENSSELNYIVCGSDIERWILKTILGLVKSGQITQENKSQFLLKEKCIDLLCLPKARWPLGWGLYVSIPSTPIYHSSSFELIPKSNIATGELLQLGLKLNGIEMNFLMGKPDNPKSFGLFRPKSLVFKKDLVVSEISLNWGGRHNGESVIFSQVGTYNGESPDHLSVIKN